MGVDVELRKDYEVPRHGRGYRRGNAIDFDDF